MKILQVSPRFYPYIGGVENHVMYLSKELVRRGNSVRVVCAEEPKSNIKELDGVEIIRLPFIGKVANTNITPLMPMEIWKGEWDVVHAHLPTPWSSDWAAIVSKVKGRPFVLTYHNDIVATGIGKAVARLYNKTMLKMTLSLADKVIITEPRYSMSENLRDVKRKVEVVPNGVDLERFNHKKSEKRRTVLFLGIVDKYHAYKGVGYLLKAFKDVRESVGDAVLLIAGEGEMRERYMKMSEQLGIDGCTDFLGFVKEKELVDVYNSCSVFVLPSTDKVQEGFGMVALEAMACEKPVVVSEVVGVAEDVRRCECGETVKPRDVGGLADSIVRLLKDKELSRKMGKNGRALVEKKYNWKTIAKDVEHLYESIKG